MRRWLAGLALASRLVAPVFGYGTTVSIAVSYCPATYPSPSGTTSSPSTTPTSTPGNAYVLFLALSGQPEYISEEGSISTDPREAVIFTITPSGQLMSGEEYVSTTGDLPSQPFEASPIPAMVKRLGLITTVFSLTGNNTLVWRNDEFVGHEAVFCVFGSILQIIFNGIPPAGCIVVQIGAIPASELNLPPASSSLSSGIFSSGLSTEMTPPSSGSGFTPSSTATAAGTLVSWSMTSGILQPSTIASGSQTAPPNTAASSASRTTSPGLGQSSSPATPSYAESSTSPGFPAPTTTGTPNCFDRSPFDGTVNDDYLILCDTDLPGFELDAVPASDLADCIDACNSYVPSSDGPCIAVEFDILAEANACKLKFNIGVVDRGANAFAQAAIVVNKPYSPPIVFSDTGISSVETSNVGPSTIMSTVELGTTEIIAPTTTPTLPLTSAPSNANSPVSSVMTTQQQNSPSPPPPTSPVQQSSLSPSVSTTTRPGSTSPSSPAATVATVTTTSPGQQPASTPTTSRIASSSLPSSTASFPSSSVLSSLASSPSSPVPSSATSSPSIPSSSSSVSSAPISSQSPLSSGSASTSPVLSPSSNTPVASSTLVLGTSTTSTTSTTTTSLALTSSAPSTQILPTAASTSTLTTTTTPSYCSATPTTANLCPSYNHQGLNVNNDGVCYEVECTTTLQGAILTGNSTTAASLKACIGFCTLYNVALPYGCVGVNYLGASSGNNPNCILFSSVSGTSPNAGVDSGRLLYPGYPSINDPVFTVSTTTTTTTTTPVQSSALTTSPSFPTTTMTSTTTTTPYVPSICPAGPTASACPGTSPTCYSYSNYGNPANFEIECGTSFQGAALQPLLVFSLEDCISWCQYANVLTANSCLGLTYQGGSVGQGTANNCFRYGSLTCASRGNSNFDSARLLYAGYQQMTDYNNPSFLCPAVSSSSVAASTTTSR